MGARPRPVRPVSPEPARRPARVVSAIVVVTAWLFTACSGAPNQAAAPATPPLAPAGRVHVAVEPAAELVGLPGGNVFTSNTSGSRLSGAQLHALKLLCDRHPGVAGAVDTGIGNDVFGPVKEMPLAAGEQRRFDQQWAAAAAAAQTLATPEEAAALGYVLASGFDAGIGRHWIKWSSVGKPFDPATPAMLLFDGLPGRTVQLVGFSYWVGSGREPSGFAGPNDRWHRHGSLCFDKNGWLTNSNVSNGHECKRGFWLDGQSLWMLHAWVVPGLPNTWGAFAPTNPYLCPPPSSKVPDLASCQSH